MENDRPVMPARSFFYPGTFRGFQQRMTIKPHSDGFTFGEYPSAYKWENRFDFM